MAKRGPRPSGIVYYSVEAAEDYSDIYDHTAHLWGVAQAERYAELIDKAADGIALFPEGGRIVEALSQVRSIFVKWRKARHGHLMLHWPTAGGIEIIRILHTSMDVGSYFE